MQLPGTPDFLPSDSQSLLDQLWAGAAKGMQPPTNRPAAVVGECIDDRHPVIDGKVLIAYPSIDGLPRERWLATLRGLTVRVKDRVILMRPANWPEPVVTGVLCGIDEEAPAPMRSGPALRIAEHESLEITGPGGEPFVEISRGKSGPIVHLLAPDVEIETPGKLRISARSIELEAHRGDLKIEASNDVVVRGEMVRLN